MALNEEFFGRSYRPPTLSGKIVLILVVTFAVIDFGRGVDMTFGNRPASSLVVLRALAPIEMWGSFLMLGGLALIISWLFRNQISVWVSHTYLCALNVCLTISVTQAALLFHGGFGAAAMPLSAAIWHLAHVYLTSPVRRPEWDD